MKSRLCRDVRDAGPSSGSNGAGEVYALGSRLATAENSTQRSSSCNSRKRGLAAYSSALENVPGDKKASSSKRGVPLKESGILPSGSIGGTGASMLVWWLRVSGIWGRKRKKRSAGGANNNVAGI